MNNVKILDCTLRDGGYVNEWKFGKKAIKHILFNLAKSNTDIIECGFLTNKPYDETARCLIPLKKSTASSTKALTATQCMLQ